MSSLNSHDSPPKDRLSMSGAVKYVLVSSWKCEFLGKLSNVSASGSSNLDAQNIGLVEIPLAPSSGMQFVGVLGLQFPSSGVEGLIGSSNTVRMFSYRISAKSGSVAEGEAWISS